MEDEIQLKVSRQGDRLLVFWRGDVDMANVTTLEQRTLGTVQNSDSTVIIDLTDVAYLDSAGIRSLLTIRRRLEDRQQQLSLVLPDDSLLRKALEIGGVPSVIPVHPSVAALEP
ncbi:MAG TPA: STAS domain-containing protein [Actinomycetota bacterium]|nr:STAS domain-containing protein [Actinomycetota bacterium]